MVDKNIFVGGLPLLLSYEETMELFANMQNGESKARDKLILHNLRLVTSRINLRFKSYEDREELFSVGIVGLIKAVDSFKKDRETTFASYAVKCIDNEILGFLVNDDIDNAISLDSVVSKNDNDEITSVFEILASDIDLERSVVEKDSINLLYNAIEILTAKDKDLVYLYYFKNYTLEQIGNLKGVSRQCISKRLKKILIKLKNLLEKKVYVKSLKKPS